MDSVFSKEYSFRTFDRDKSLRIKPSAILDVFQDVAGAHTLQFGCDRASMNERGVHWVLASVRYEKLREPDDSETVVVSTWPLKSKGVKYFREFVIRRIDGEVLIKGDSCWAIIDTLTKSVFTEIKPYPEDFDYCDESAFDGKMSKICDFEPENALISLKPRFNDLDFNGHVNNAKYADYITDALFANNDKDIKYFQIDYRKEVALNDELLISSANSGGDTLVKGIGTDGATRFFAKIGYR